MTSLIDPAAEVSAEAEIGEGTQVWPEAQVRERARIGGECRIGRGAYVGPGVVVGNRCKLQSHALVYEPAVLEDGVFVGPGVVFTNDNLPRAVDHDGNVKEADPWSPEGVVVREGASIGAGAVCVAPIEVGRWAMVAAGAVVTHDVPDFALVAGVPARQLRWVGRAGVPLEYSGADSYRCPLTGQRYVELDGRLHERPDTD